MTEPTAAAPGWYPDPTMPGTQRYWTGEAWSDHVAPAATSQPSMSAWKGIRIVAVGILAALAVVWVVVQLSRPSDLDCATQRLEVANGTRASIDSDCVGR